MRSEEFGYMCLGIAIGASMAALFAPNSGAETRDYLRSKAAEGTDYARNRADELRRSANDVIDRGAKAANDVIDRGTRVVKAQAENLQAAVDAGKEAYRESVLTNPNG